MGADFKAVPMILMRAYLSCFTADGQKSATAVKGDQGLLNSPCPLLADGLKSA